MGTVQQVEKEGDDYWTRNNDYSSTTVAGCEEAYYCFSIANNILPFREDAEESVNDTYMTAWNVMPPNRPSILSTFLGKLTRRISIDRWRNLSADKRGGGTVPIALDELAECIPGGSDPVAEVEAKELAEAVGRFLDTVSYTERKVFLRRYFDLAKIQDIAIEFKMSTGKVKSMLYRTRNELKVFSNCFLIQIRPAGFEF